MKNQVENELVETAAKIAAWGESHGMSRAQLDHHHSGTAHPISNGLMSEDDLAAIFAPYFDVDVKISDDRMYQVSGVRK